MEYAATGSTTLIPTQQGTWKFPADSGDGYGGDLVASSCETLRDRLKRERQLPLEDALAIVDFGARRSTYGRAGRRA